MKISEWPQHINDYFKGDFHFTAQVKWFRKALFVYLLINTLICLPEFSYLWGKNSFVAFQNHYSVWHPGNLLNLLSIFPSPYTGVGLISVQIALLTLGIFGKWNRWTVFFIWCSTYNLFNPIHLGITGGEVLVHLSLFYLIFIDERKVHQINRLLNNTFFWVMRIQVIFVYVFAAWYKLYDPNWISGDALYFTLQIDAFSRPFFTGFLLDYPILLKLGTYLTLMYQILFPFLIWWKKIKKPFLIVGIFFHLIIAFVVGVFSFGIIMILVYLLWWDYDKKTNYYSI